MLYIGNAFSLGMLTGETSPVVRKVSVQQVVNWLYEEPNFVSCVGHADTARLFSNILENATFSGSVGFNRISVELKPGDRLIVGQYYGPRLPEGITKLPEGAKVVWWCVELPGDGPSVTCQAKDPNVMTWSDGQGRRDRQAWALVVYQGKVYLFQGQTIPGIIAVVGYDYTKSGKWSYTTYRLRLATGAVFLAGHAGWETGRFVEGLSRCKNCRVDTWDDLALALCVSRSEAERFLRSWKPAAAKELDEVEAGLASLG